METVDLQELRSRSTELFKKTAATINSGASGKGYLYRFVFQMKLDD